MERGFRMRNLSVLFLLSATSLFAQDRVQYLNPPTSASGLHSRQVQGFAEEVFAKQDRQYAEFVASIEEHEFTTVDKKIQFIGKFISFQNGYARIICEDGAVHRVPISKLSSADGKYMRETIRLRKGLKPTQITKKK